MAGEHIAGAGLPDDNRGPVILAATSVVTICALLTVLARLYVRVFIIRNVGADDYTMVLTMVLSLAGWAIIIPEVIYGAGRHTAYVRATAVKANQLNFATQAIYMWAVGLVKVSIGLFLLRFAPKKKYKVFIWTIIVLMALYTTICFFTLIFQCRNIRSIWDPSVKSKCFKPTELMQLGYIHTALNILTDLTFAVLPAFMLRHLQVNRRVKATLVCILGLGVFACAAAFIKLSFLPNYGRTGDFLWDYSNLTIWVVVECNTGIMAGSLPTLKPLFKQVLSSYGYHGSQSRSRKYYSGGTPYKLRSLLRPNHSKPQTLASDNFDADVQAQRKGPLTSQSAYKTTTTASYPGREGSSASEELILPARGEGIVCVTEIVVSHSQAQEGGNQN